MQDEKDLMASIFRFMKETDRLKSVARSDYISDFSRKENPAEHTWHAMLLLMIYVLQKRPDIDVTRVLFMLIIHDLPEIFYRDTPIFSSYDKDAVAEEEAKALKQLLSALPEGLASNLQELWGEFEHGRSKEAVTARFFDKFQGFTQNFATDGRGWHEWEADKADVLTRLDNLDVADEWLQELRDHYIGVADDLDLWFEK